MTPLKDTLEAVYPAAESDVSQPLAQPSKPAGHLRSDAVSLEIPVKIHGSRVIEVSRGVTPRTEPFEEQTSTMIVFPQGGVLRVSTVVSVGQMLILTNLKSRQDAICRVVKVRTQASGSAGYVEIEFTQPQPGYWGVYFSTDAPEPAKKTASAPSPAAPATPARENAVPDASWVPAPNTVSTRTPEAPSLSPEVKPLSPAPARVIPPVKPESTFISMGSQEKVQLAATDVPQANVVAPPRRIPGMTFPSEASVAPPAAPPRSLSMEELLADVQPGIIPAPAGSSAGVSEPAAKVADAPVESPASNSRAAFARSASGAAPGSELSAPVESLGARFESGPRVRDTQERRPGHNSILIAACAALLVAGAAGGFFYLRHRHAAPGGSGAFRPAAVQPVPQPGVAPVAANVVPNLVVEARTALPLSHLNSAAHANPPGAGSAAVSANPSSGGTASTVAPSQSSSPAKHAAPSVAKDLFGTLNAHPVSTQTAASQAEAAPSVPPPTISASDANSLGGAASPAASVLPPSAANSQRALAPGASQVTQPRLISSPQPAYPAIAAQMRTQGDVVIKARIDANGRVAAMQVISGPEILQQAALNALRQWKYQPSKLDGQPVPAEIQVIIRFRL